MEKTVYVIGHKNPDTDSVVAAAAYAYLKRSLGLARCVAARAGRVNPQTEYVFERFDVELPTFLPDLVPRVAHQMRGLSDVARRGTPLWRALGMMGDDGTKSLPIVDDGGAYVAMLHYGAFARNILKKINPHRKAVVPTSVSRMAETMKAQPVCVFDGDESFRGQILVAALETGSFKAHLDAEAKDSVIVVVGDRIDVQRYAIESGVRCLVITNGSLLPRELKDLAEERRVSVLVSPYDTSSTTLLVIYSTPAETMADADIAPVGVDTPLKRARESVMASASRSVAVVDDAGLVIGLLTESDLIAEPNVELILVDHNELSQAVEGAEHYRILEVIDHHRLGSFSTKYPITFINRVVGSTSTIVTSMFRETRTPIPKPIASILLCGILSDTLTLKSATTTDVDRETAEYLANIADLEIADIGRDILSSASFVGKMPAKDIVRLDIKEYVTESGRISVSQAEADSPDGILARKTEIFAELRALRESRGLLLAALMVTDITALTSLLFLEADRDLHHLVAYPRVDAGIYELKDILSRKKQLMPVIFELVERAAK
ncbi:MAG: putative manganese-dependent inorganic diphosphatase [Spirochaetes bacterium]|nr:putative manganese-dependent inorganic diphosphatase [Spirochaetota bacterium]